MKSIRQQEKQATPFDFKSLFESIKIHLHPLIAHMYDFLDGEIESYRHLKRYISQSREIPEDVMAKFAEQFSFIKRGASQDKNEITLREVHLLELLLSYDIGGKYGIKADLVSLKMFRELQEEKSHKAHKRKWKESAERELKEPEETAEEPAPKLQSPVHHFRHEMFALGKKYALQNDEKRAFEHYLKAAEHGHIPAIFKIAHALHHGIGVEINLDHASSLYLILSQHATSSILSMVMNELGQLQGEIQFEKEETDRIKKETAAEQKSKSEQKSEPEAPKLDVKKFSWLAKFDITHEVPRPKIKTHSWLVKYNVAKAYNDEAELTKLKETLPVDLEGDFEFPPEKPEPTLVTVVKAPFRFISAAMGFVTGSQPEEKEEAQAAEEKTKPENEATPAPSPTFKSTKARLSVTLVMPDGMEKPLERQLRVYSTGSINNSSESKALSKPRHKHSDSLGTGEGTLMARKRIQIDRPEEQHRHLHRAQPGGFLKF